MKHPFEEILPAKQASDESKNSGIVTQAMSRRELAGLVVVFPAFTIVGCDGVPWADDKADSSGSKCV